MRGSLRYFLIVAALLTGAFFVACGGDSDDNGDNGADDPAAEQPVDNGDDGDNDGDGNDGNGDDSDGDASGALSDLAGQFGVSEVKVEYNMTSSGSGDDLDGTMTLYWKPPDAWRMDIGTSDGDIAIIYDGDVTYMCASEGGEGTCFESPLGGDTGVPFLNIFTDPDEFDDLIGSSFGGVDVNKSSRKIAGQDATCFEVSGEVDDEQSEGEFCFRDDGVLLLMRAAGSGFESDGEFSLEATSVSNSVSDEDLEPLYEILDLGGLIP